MELMHVLPEDIERTSFSIIEKELNEKGIVLPPENADVIKRVIHTTADFDYAETLSFSTNAVIIASKALKEGAHIVTDTNMALSGISKKTLEKLGGKVHCFMAEPEIALEAKKRGTTRASVSMEKASTMGCPLIFAIGNAPTALISLFDLIEHGFKPELIIAVPVGFVNVEYAKELILSSGVPYIVNKGRKGGSTVAAAICNALLYGIDQNRGA